MVEETSITLYTATIEWVLSDPYSPSRAETFRVLYGSNVDQLTRISPEVDATQANQYYTTQLSSLDPGTLYFYKIDSTNRYDTLFTSLFNFTTSRLHNYRLQIIYFYVIAESRRVSNLQILPQSSTALAFSWEPPDETVYSYLISIIDLNNESVIGNYSIFTTNITLAGLSKYIQLDNS